VSDAVSGLLGFIAHENIFSNKTPIEMKFQSSKIKV